MAEAAVWSTPREEAPFGRLLNASGVASKLPFPRGGCERSDLPLSSGLSDLCTPLVGTTRELDVYHICATLWRHQELSQLDLNLKPLLSSQRFDSRATLGAFHD